MTDAEKIVLVKHLCDEEDDAVISAFLSLAEDAITHYADPYHTTDRTALMEEYGGVQVKAAAYYINKQGWDFQTSHSENGVVRSFEAGDLPASILREIVTKAGTVT